MNAHVGLLCLMLSACAPLLAGVPPGEARELPRFLVILADDLGYADLRQDGGRTETPHLDRLAAEGLKLTRFYASGPMCSPTRAAILTGRYPHAVGMPALASEEPRGAVPVLGLAPDAVTIPEALKPLGYASALVGKWHLGFRRQDWPRTHGFDAFWGSLAGTPGYWKPVHTYHNEEPIQVDGYYTDRLADKAIEYLRAFRATPFFLLLSFTAPHYPLEAPAELIAKYRRLDADPELATYAAMVERLDWNVGRVLSALDELGLASSTLVLFLSDNGPSAEAQSYGLRGARVSAGPLRGHKFSVHEGGIRVPFIARWPGRIPAGQRRSEIASTLDLMPTLLETAGVVAKPEAADGRSILPLLSGKTFERALTLHWETRHNLAVLQEDWKLVHQFWEPAPRLYNLKDDPAEADDLAPKHAAKVSELEGLHAAWRRRYYADPLPPARKRSAYHFPER